MKKIALLMAVLLAGACCRTPEIQSGDLLFVGIPADYSLSEDGMASAIASATGEGATNFIHTAILDVDDQGIWVIDATLKHGVDRHPLDTFLTDFTLKDGSLPVLEVYRLVDDPLVPQYVAATARYIGEQYDVHFLPGNDRHYCTELVYDCYADGDEHVFTAAPMNFRNAEGEFPVYWQQLFALIDSSIPQDEPGTNPQAMRAEIVSSDRFVQIPFTCSSDRSR